MLRFLEIIRLALFWGIDFFKGRPLSKKIKSIKRINAAYPESKSEIEKTLATMLEYAAANTEYYKQYTNGNISQFPVIDKTTIKENLDAFIATGYNKEELFKVVTSGSTGTPFFVYHSKEKKQRNTADTLVFAERAGFKPGQRLYYFKIWNEINKKSSFISWRQNIVPYDVFDLSDDAIKILLERVKKDKSTIGFLGYASAYDAVCRYMDANGYARINANVQSAITMSEGLNDYTKKAVQKYFGTACVSRYSNVENGIIAQQSVRGGNEFYINFASYYVEVLNFDNNELCDQGKEGRIVVTDLYNFAMPIIRYDTGDVGVISNKFVDGKKVPVLEKVEGRKMDMVFDTRGNLVSSFTITNTMWRFTELKQYQFIQCGEKQYLFKLNCEGAFSREAELVDDFKKFFGSDADMKVEYVDGIPLLNSGKRKKVMNTYHSQPKQTTG